MDLSDEATKHWTDVSVIARQASVFNDCCRIFAPRYRQASFLAATDPTMEGDGEKSYSLAYSDVLRAFDQWISSRNGGRPFILAGHSQGAEMVMRLLADRIDQQRIQRRMVAAYAIGIDFSEGYFGRRYKTLQPCTRPAQIRCVLSWNAVTPEFQTNVASPFAARYLRTYGTEEGRKATCINPLTFDSRRPDAPASQSKGAAPGEPGDGPVPALVGGKVAASCRDGFLVVNADQTLGLKPLPGGFMHYHEFGLFYADIKMNVFRRIAAFP